MKDSTRKLHSILQGQRNYNTHMGSSVKSQAAGWKQMRGLYGAKNYREHLLGRKTLKPKRSKFKPSLKIVKAK
jgi:hypothetical protein